MTPFAWHEYLELAERLAIDRSSEADLRSALSRASYAAYHAAAFVRATQMLTTAHTHAKVWRTFAIDPDPTRARLGLRGNQLRKARVTADYRNPFDGNLLTEVRSALIASREIIDAITVLPSQR